MTINGLPIHTWLLYELCPSFYVNGPNWKDMRKEASGWLFQHIPLGFMFYAFVPHLWAIALAALIIEVIESARVKFAYVNPINSLLDIGFYVLGGVIFIWR
jgi:hypothetical protein